MMRSLQPVADRSIANGAIGIWLRNEQKAFTTGDTNAPVLLDHHRQPLRLQPHRRTGGLDAEAAPKQNGRSKRPLFSLCSTGQCVALWNRDCGTVLSSPGRPERYSANCFSSALLKVGFFLPSASCITMPRITALVRPMRGLLSVM